MNIVWRGFILLLLALSAACNVAERQRLKQQLASLEQHHAKIAHSLLLRQNAMAQMEDQVRGLKVDLALHNTETVAYIEQHQVAAGCIRVVKASFGQGSTYAQQASKLTQMTAVVCTVALLNSVFAQEVRQVELHIDQADIRAKGLKAQITGLENKIRKERAELRVAKNAVDRAFRQVIDVRRQLEAL